ncbi:MAG: LysM domain-containing protein [Candidatus Moranbacteria bacterium]|nr:LysM domain-containing protein [Candidatus Moranbacteria bacterium]MDD3964987.1 LysM domain-containing protein [Candidatus Moranbacteria bacterium]
MIIKMIATFLVVLFAFFGTANAEVYTVKAGDTLSKVAGKNWKAVCLANSLRDCSKIFVGQRLELSVPVRSVKTVNKSPAEFRWTHVGGAPLTNCGGKSANVLNEEAWMSLGLTESEKQDLHAMITRREHRNTFIQPGERYEAVAFCKNGSVSFKHNVITAWAPGSVVVLARTYVLTTGRKLHWVRNCNNWVLDTPVVSTPPVIMVPPKEVPVAEPEIIAPFHVTPAEVAGKPRCEAQAGAGVHANQVYQGQWLYGETICYIWQNGEWQAGPGLYAMYGSGDSLTSAYHGQELGYGVQFGAQKNWVNDRNRLTTFDLKLRLLRDKSWGENPESGYSFTQNGYKLGAYAGYTERLNKEGDLAGIVGEYWKSFGQSVSSTWAGQPVQDRGSVSLSGFYETKLSDDDKWRQRLIGGWAFTNWDEQHWLKATYEVRYDKWLMFGPQLSVPLGISHLNQPLTSGDLTTVGAFVRVELGGKVREADAKSRDGQLDFISAIMEASSSPPE